MADRPDEVCERTALVVSRTSPLLRSPLLKGEGKRFHSIFLPVKIFRTSSIAEYVGKIYNVSFVFNRFKLSLIA